MPLQKERSERKTPAAAARKPGESLWLCRLWPLLLILATLAVFARIATDEFSQLDDPTTMNSRVLATQGIGYYWTHAADQIYIPLTYSVWGALRGIAALDHPDTQGFSLNPWIYHGASILLHLLSALVIYALLRDLLQRRGRDRASTRFAAEIPAMLGAMLFALHPIQVEAVAWASGMKDVLYGLLSLIALWQYARFAIAAEDDAAHPQAARWYYALATIAFIAAMLAKPTAAVTPLMAAAIDLWIVRRPFMRVVKSLALWAVLAVPILVIARIAQPALDVQSTPLWTRPLIALASLAFYLRQLILPLHLEADYGWRPIWVVQQSWIYFAWIVPVALGIWLWLGRKKRPWLLAAGAIFVIGPLPMLGFTRYAFQTFSTVADHYLYLAMLGPAMALAWGVWHIASRRAGFKPPASTSGGNGGLKPALRGAVVWLAVLVLAALGVRSYLQAATWKDEQMMWSHTLATNPRSFLASSYLGDLSREHLQFPEALRYYRQTAALNSRDTHARGWCILIYRQLRQFDQEDAAGKDFARVAATSPLNEHNGAAQVLLGLAASMYKNHRYDRAVEYAKDIEALSPNPADPQTMAGFHSQAAILKSAAQAQMQRQRSAATQRSTTR